MLTLEQLDAVRQVTSAALDHERGRTTEWRFPPSMQGADFVHAVVRHRLLDVLAPHRWAWEERGMPHDVGARLAGLTQHSSLLALAQTRTVAQVVHGCRSAGIPALLIKGQPLAVITTHDPLGRGPGDVDLFVAPESVEAAVGVLGDLGFRPRPKVPLPGSPMWPYLLRWYYELALDGPGGQSVDLHWWVDPRRAHLPSFHEAWARRRHVEIAGNQVATLSAEDTFRHACAHACKDDWRWLRSLVDVWRLAACDRQWGPGARLAPVERLTLAVLRDTVGLPDLPPHVRDQLRRNRHARLAADRQRGPAPIHGDAQSTFPGLEALRRMRSHARASASWSDLRRQIALRLFMPVTAGEVRPSRGVPVLVYAVMERARRFRRQLTLWRTARGPVR